MTNKPDPLPLKYRKLERELQAARQKYLEYATGPLCAHPSRMAKALEILREIKRIRLQTRALLEGKI